MNRVDLRNLDQGNAGRENFVFGLLENGNTQQAVVMFEYKLPAATEAGVLAWAQSFHALAALPFTQEARTFNDLLRRRQDLEAIVCPPEPTVSLRHGIARVH